MSIDSILAPIIQSISPSLHLALRHLKEKDLVDVYLKVAAGIGALVAFTIGLGQYREGIRWKQAELVKRLFDAFRSDPHNKIALTLIDWWNVRIDFSAVGLSLADSFIDEPTFISALVVYGPDDAETRYSPEGKAIRDCFDHLFDDLESFQAQIDTKVLRERDVRPYLAYWCRRLTGTDGLAPRREDVIQALAKYRKEYGYKNAGRLIESLSKPPIWESLWILPQRVRPAPVAMRPSGTESPQ